jgi:hypothetical protein
MEGGDLVIGDGIQPRVRRARHQPIQIRDEMAVAMDLLLHRTVRPVPVIPPLEEVLQRRERILPSRCRHGRRILRQEVALAGREQVGGVREGVVHG